MSGPRYVVDSDRSRVAAVIVRNDQVLMVRERGPAESGIHLGQEDWTLPGAGVEPGETLERAVRREVVGLQASVVAYLALPFQRSMGHTDTASGYIEDDIFQSNQSFDSIASL
jgi:ADP-ribose pyrophosphatase YjhB (NUDIX family)